MKQKFLGSLLKVYVALAAVVLAVLLAIAYMTLATKSINVPSPTGRTGGETEITLNYSQPVVL